MSFVLRSQSTISVPKDMRKAASQRPARGYANHRRKKRCMIRQLIFSTLLLCLGTLCAAEDAYAQTVQYFPQLADGGGYVTTWYFTGLGSGSVVTLELFQANGTPLTLATNRGTANIFTFSVDAAGELSIRSQGLPFAVQVGWARVTSSQPIGATEVFQFLFGGQVISQAGVLASDPTAIATLLVSVDGGRGRNTGFALANLALTSNPVTFTLYNQTGTPVATTTRVLAPQTQTAQFVPELPGFASFTSFEGTLGISALSRFSVVGLVLDGLELSTLPTLPGRIQGRTSNTVTVLGVADIYLAGMPAGFTFV